MDDGSAGVPSGSSPQRDDNLPGETGSPSIGPASGNDRLRRRMDFVFLALVLSIFAVISCRHYAASTDPDIWWHIRTGDWIFQHGSLPYFDVFSYTTYGKPWVEYSWLFDVLISKLFSMWGPGGVPLFASVLVVLNLAGLTAILARYTHLARALALTMFAYLTTFQSLGTPRPWLFTIGFFTVELWLLLLASERGRWIWLCPIVPLMILWASIHIQFVYGLALIGLFALLNSIPGAGYPAPSRQDAPRRLSGLSLWLLLVASFLVTLVNPYGWRVYTVVWDYATQKCTLLYIGEMQSPSFRGPLDYLLLGFVCATWFILGRSPRRSILLLVLFAAATWCGFRTARDLWFVAIVAAIILAQCWGPVGRKGQTLGLLHWAAAIAISLLLVFTVPGLRVSDSVIANWMKTLYPVEACSFIESHHLSPPLYNSYTWGGYLMWRLPQLPVSMDGRTNVHADAQVINAMETTHGAESWAKDEELFRARTILLERRRPLTWILRADPRFRLVYEDKTALVFEPAAQPATAGGLTSGQRQ